MGDYAEAVKWIEETLRVDSASKSIIFTLQSSNFGAVFMISLWAWCFSLDSLLLSSLVFMKSDVPKGLL